MPFVNTLSILRIMTPLVFSFGCSKFGGFSPEGNVFINEFARLSVKKGPHKKVVGELPTTDIQNDSMYLCPVTIGVAPNAVTVNLDFDTGSSDLWGIFFLPPKTSLIFNF